MANRMLMIGSISLAVMTIALGLAGVIMARSGVGVPTSLVGMTAASGLLLAVLYGRNKCRAEQQAEQ